MGGIDLPQCEPNWYGEVIAGCQRLSDLERLTRDVDVDGCFEHRAQQGQEQAEARLLDHPGSVGVKLPDDLAKGLGLLLAHRLRDALDVEVGDPPPVEVTPEQEAIADGPNVAPLPESLRVLLVGLGSDALRSEVRTCKVQQPGDARGTSPVHAQDDQLHGQTLPSRLVMGTGPPRAEPGDLVRRVEVPHQARRVGPVELCRSRFERAKK